MGNNLVYDNHHSSISDYEVHYVCYHQNGCNLSTHDSLSEAISAYNDVSEGLSAVLMSGDYSSKYLLCQKERYYRGGDDTDWADVCKEHVNDHHSKIVGERLEKERRQREEEERRERERERERERKRKRERKKEKERLDREQQNLIQQNWFYEEQLRQLKKKEEEYLKLLNELKEQLQQFKKQPERFKKEKTELEDQFIVAVKELCLNFDETILQSESPGNNICFLGPISSGKSTLIKALFRVDLAIGKAHTTKQCKRVHTHQAIQVWDAPGINEDFELSEVEDMKFLFGLKRIYFVYSSDPRASPFVIKLLLNCRPDSVFFVRTQLDGGVLGGSVESIKESDLECLRSWGAQFGKERLFGISAQMFIENKLDKIFEFNELKNHVMQLASA